MSKNISRYVIHGIANTITTHHGRGTKYEVDYNPVEGYRLTQGSIDDTANDMHPVTSYMSNREIYQFLNGMLYGMGITTAKLQFLHNVQKAIADNDSSDNDSSNPIF